MKRIIATAISVMLLLMSLPVMAEGGFRMIVENTDAVPGGSVMVAIKAENNPGIALGKIKLTYDNSILVPVSVDRGDVLSSAYQFTSNLEDPSVDSSELEYVNISWMNFADIKSDGTLAVVEFAVQEHASGTSELALEIIELANAQTTNVSAEEANGSISFGGGGEAVTDNEVVLGFSETTVSRNENNAGGGVSVSVFVKEAEKATFVYTIFDDKHNLLAVKQKAAELKAGINEVSLGELVIRGDEETNYTIKEYMWDSTAGMVPLSETISRSF